MKYKIGDVLILNSEPMQRFGQTVEIIAVYENGHFPYRVKVTSENKNRYKYPLCHEHELTRP